MNSILHPADSRGAADHGWLKTFHTFSFADYYDPERMGFGALRVLNDDIIAGGLGFGTHHHENMEIVTIPLEGDLEHADSMGNRTIIKHGEVQVMSAGTGVDHSEYNASVDRPVKLLQIWVMPDKRDVTPRYDQISLKPGDRHNKLQQIVSPDQNDDGVWVHQNTWFHLGRFDKGKSANYQLKKKGHGVYIFVINGSVKVGDRELHDRDGYGVWDTEQLSMTALSDAELLLMEVPMEAQIKR